jgi:hypothetical protein
MFFASWLRSRKSPAARRLHRTPARTRLSVERLEDRALPAAHLGWAFALTDNVGSYIYGTATDSAGDLYVTGNFNATNFNPLYGNTITNSNGSNFVAKYAPSGALLWVTPTTDGCTAIAVDGAGDAFVAGTMRNSSGTSVADVAKFDPNGNLLWTQTPGGYWAKAIAVDSAGNAYISGFSAASSTDAIMAKLNGADGSVAWFKQLNAHSERATGIAVDAAGDAYIAGNFSGKVNFNPGTGTYYLKANKTTNLAGFVLKLDTNGNFLWAVADQGAAPNAIVVDGAGNAYTTGGPTAASHNSGKVVIEKLDSNGNTSWTRNLGGTYAGSAIALDAAGNVYTTGEFSGSGVNFDPGPGQHLLDSGGPPAAFVSVLNNAGNFVYAGALGTYNTVPSNAWATGAAIAVDSAGDIYVVGRFRGSANFDPTGGTTILSSPPNVTNGFLAKLTLS